MRRLLFKRILPFIVVIVVASVGGIYGLLRSESFLKNRALPWLSTQLGQPISAERIQIWPFSGLQLQGVRFNCEGSGEACPPNKPFSLRIGSLETKYDFKALFARRLHITSLRASDVHIDITTGPSQQQQQPAPAEQPSTGSNSSTLPASPMFAFRISDTVLERSSFSLKSSEAPDSYRFDAINITIPEADSHQDGKVSISSKASIRSAAVSLDNQPISLSGTLYDSRLFMPTRLDLDISAGSASPAPLELKSNLIFTQEPYALSKVSIQKGSIRQSLLQALSIPFAPLKEFEYSLSGEYSLTTPASAAFNIDVLKNVFEYGSNHDLKGTSLSSKLQLASDKISITDGKIAVLDNNATILSSALSGDVSLSPYKNPSTISVNASLANVDLIRTLLNEIQPPTTTSDSTNSAQPSSQSAPTSSSQASAPAIQMPVGSLDVRADKVIIQGIDTKSFTIAIKVPESRTIEKAALDAGFSQGGALSMNASGSFDKSLSFKASGKDVNMIPFAAAASGPKGEILEGSLKSLDVNISAEARDIRKTLQGHATVSFSRLIVPSTLQEQIPFNILFLPLDALITVFGGTLNMLLPASISSISDSIRQTLDDAGRLGIDNSIVDLGFDKGKILLKNVDINTKNLPDFTFKGSITSEDRLNLTVFIALLKLNLPLPIAGTMSTPLPDIMYLGPEIVRGLGLSVGSLAGSAASIFGGGSNKSETNQESPAALNR